MISLPRRALLLGLVASSSGCAALGALENASRALPTYELTPVAGSGGARRAVTLVVARPEAPAAISTDRILIKPDPLSVAYLPDARWSEEVPQLVQSLVIRSIAESGRLGYVGSADGGPLPDVALLLRVDAFQAEPVAGQDAVPVRTALSASLIRDSDQRVLASRDFAGASLAASDRPADLVPAFQNALGPGLAALADWVARTV
ncbi:ABC-type transport auxiliary lipoprotein family protein [Jannaschia pohangensis]|uniref:Cholesterol transport system auxiliary component n=1 Tax=Jannaschia pohangensis TaxID=390807 RepID=A0A1I3H1F5_9RHOB|nr:ABC-type transport auxiliary lipoprotein family protein [Jannaschia pohangensis]SFI29377.1 cholesterol transport system auxiliary component [Jannaschia pohangensis]